MIRTIGPRDGGLQAFSVAIPLGSAVGERDGFRCDAGEKATQGRRGCSGRAGADDPRCLRASERAADAVGAFARQRTLQETEIGRAWSRDRVCKNVKISVVA